MLDILIEKTQVGQIKHLWPLLHSTQKPQILFHSSVIYPDPIFKAPAPFHSKSPNSSSHICHLPRSNFYGPYSIRLKSPKFQFTHLPFTQIQSLWPLLLSTQNPKIQFAHMPFIQIKSSWPSPFHSNAPN